MDVKLDFNSAVKHLYHKKQQAAEIKDLSAWRYKLKSDKEEISRTKKKFVTEFKRNGIAII